MPSLKVTPTTDRVLTFNCYVQSQSRYGHYSLPIQMQKVKGHLVQKFRWKQMDRQMDGANYITSLANAVSKNVSPRCS